MLVTRRAGGPIRKPLGLKKKKKLSRLTISLLPWQEPTSSLDRILKKTEEIVVIDDKVVQLPISRPLVQTQLTSSPQTILMVIEIDPQKT